MRVYFANGQNPDGRFRNKYINNCLNKKILKIEIKISLKCYINCPEIWTNFLTLLFSKRKGKNHTCIIIDIRVKNNSVHKSVQVIFEPPC